jgi:hypothetical protein
LLPLAGGCANTQVKADHDPQAQFASYRTFAVTGGKLQTSGVEVRDRWRWIASARRWAPSCRTRGCGPVERDPDLVVTYSAAATGVEDATGGPGLGWWTLPPELWDRAYTESTLVIDVTDAATDKLVYRATAVAAPRDLASERFIRRAVAKALAKYPRGGA